MQTKNYDVVVVGAGSGGLTTAVGLSKVGKSVLLVEKEHLGGECTNTGCIPSKALLHYAKSYREMIDQVGPNSQTEEHRHKAFSYVNSIIKEVLKDETPEHFAQFGINVVIGEAIFVTKNSVTVNGQTYNFKKAVIATGSSPRTISIDGLEYQQILTNQNIFKLERVPEQLLIVGAGPIGMELGQALAMLGSKITILDNGPRLARLEDEAISSIIKDEFASLGIEVLHHAELTSVQNSIACITYREGSETLTTTVAFKNLLVAIGRTPNLPQGLSEAGVTHTEQGITVNHNWQTSNKNIYALGDVAGPFKFTHAADDAGRQVTLHIASYGLISVKKKLIPKVTYTKPEMAQVGLSWDSAKDTFGENSLYRVEVPFSASDRAKTDNKTDGLLIIIVKRLTGQIVGAHIIGPSAGELIGTLTLAMENKLSIYRLRKTIFAYPTYSLILKKAGDYFLALQANSLKNDILKVIKMTAPKILAITVWAVALLWLYHFKSVNGLSISDITISLFTFITSTAWGPLLYILTYTLRPLTFFPGTALTILSGVFFGLPGIIYTIIGANLSASLAYLVGRFFSVDTDKTRLLSNSIDLLKHHPFMTILTMRLTFFPFDIVNYGAGLLRVPYVPFIIATIIGTILGISTFVTIGASLSIEEFIEKGLTADAIDSTFIVISVIVFIASHLVAKLVGKNYKTSNE